jgi:hypothetical protein
MADLVRYRESLASFRTRRIRHREGATFDQHTKSRDIVGHGLKAHVDTHAALNKLGQFGERPIRQSEVVAHNASEASPLRAWCA